MPHVRNAWYVAAWTCDLAPSTPMAVTILDEPIVLWRGRAGRLTAMEDRCAHRHAPLSLGRCEGDHLRCMYHGILYDDGGKVVDIPGQTLIPEQAAVRTYPVADRHDWLWVWMGDPALADPRLIPDAVGTSDPQWCLGHGQLDYQAGARLVCDNLLDFSHLTYVHANSFGSGAEFANELPHISVLERGVRVSRWMPAPVGSSRNPHSQPVEFYQSYDFLVPGILLMWSANYPEGTSARLGSVAPAMQDALSGLNFTSQAVTPMSEQTARYFFSWGPHCSDGGSDKRDMMMAMANIAFAEDKRMIEAQQRIINSDPTRRIMPTAHDKAVTLYNRLVARLADPKAVEQEVAA